MIKSFFDRNTCVRTAKILQVYEGSRGHIVRHHDDDHRFTQTSQDVDIMSTLHNEDPEWVFVGGDGKILRNASESAVLGDCDLTYIFLNSTWCNKRIEETCWMFVKAWPRILKEIASLKVHSVLELKFGSAGAVNLKGPTSSCKRVVDKSDLILPNASQPLSAPTPRPPGLRPSRARQAGQARYYPTDGSRGQRGSWGLRFKPSY